MPLRESLVQRQTGKDMRFDEGKEEEKMKLENTSGLKEGFYLFVLFVFRIEETKDVSRQREKLKMKKSVRVKI